MSEVLAGLTSPTNQTDSGNMVMKTPRSLSLAVMSPTECLSPTYRTESPNDARRHIDEEILRMEDSIRALKSRRNTHAPIARLPTELLAKIFVICAEGYHNHHNPIFRIKGWIHITHVSRYWRTVACNAPNLWAYVVFHSTNWCEEMLRRSKMAPLYIDASFSVVTRRMVDSMQLVLKQISRVKTLTVVASVPTMEKVFADVSKSAPILQTLSLSGPRQSAMYGDYAYRIPDDFLSENTSSLRRLELSHCDIGWSSPMLSGLTHMKIHHTSSTARPTAIQLLDALEKMPMLQTLDLAQCLPSDSVSSTTYDRSVNLAHLTNLKLQDGTIECGSLLSHLLFPASARISFNCQSNTCAEVDFSSVLSVFTRPSVSSFVGDEGLFLGVTFQVDSQRIVFSGYLSSANSSNLAEFTEESIIHLDFSWTASRRSISQSILLGICAALPLYGIDTAYIDSSNVKIDATAWGDALGQIDSLTKICMAGPSVHSFLQALLIPVDPDMSGCSTANPLLNFMSLNQLTLIDVDFGGTRDEPGEQWLELLDVMKERHKSGSPISTVMLSDCRCVCSSSIEELEDLVETVTWDEEEQGYTSDESDEDDIYRHRDNFGYSPTMSDLLVDDDYWPFGGL